MKIITTLISLFMLNAIQAQVKERVENSSLNNVDPDYTANVQFKEKLASLEGTFQIQYSNNTIKPLLYKETVTLINILREDTTDIYFDQCEFVKIYIPSNEKISAVDFIPLEREKYVPVVNSSNE